MEWILRIIAPDYVLPAVPKQIDNTCLKKHRAVVVNVLTIIRHENSEELSIKKVPYRIEVC